MKAAIEEIRKLKVQVDNERIQEAEKALEDSERRAETELDRSINPVKEILKKLRLHAFVMESRLETMERELKKGSASYDDSIHLVMSHRLNLLYVLQFAIIPSEVKVAQLDLSNSYVADASAISDKSAQSLSTTLSQFHEALRSIERHMVELKYIPVLTSSRELDVQNSGNQTQKHTGRYGGNLATPPFGLHCDLLSINQLLQKLAKDIKHIDGAIPWLSDRGIVTTGETKDVEVNLMAASDNHKTAVTLRKTILDRCEENAAQLQSTFQKALWKARCACFDDDEAVEQFIAVGSKSSALFDQITHKAMQARVELADLKLTAIIPEQKLLNELSDLIKGMNYQALVEDIVRIKNSYVPATWLDLCENAKDNKYGLVSEYIGKKYVGQEDFNTGEKEAIRQALRRRRGLRRSREALLAGLAIIVKQPHGAVAALPVSDLQEQATQNERPTGPVESKSDVMRDINAARLRFYQTLPATESSLYSISSRMVTSQYSEMDPRTRPQLVSDVRKTFRRVCNLIADCRILSKSMKLLESKTGSDGLSTATNPSRGGEQAHLEFATREKLTKGLENLEEEIAAMLPNDLADNYANLQSGLRRLQRVFDHLRSIVDISRNSVEPKVETQSIHQPHLDNLDELVVHEQALSSWLRGVDIFSVTTDNQSALRHHMRSSFRLPFNMTTVDTSTKLFAPLTQLTGCSSVNKL